MHSSRPITFILLTCLAFLPATQSAPLQRVEAWHDAETGTLYLNDVAYHAQPTSASSIPTPASSHAKHFLGDAPEGGQAPRLARARFSIFSMLTEEEEEETTKYTNGEPMFWVCIGTAVVLTIFAGLMSGLTVGYMGIDELDLQIMLSTGNAVQVRAAQKVLPIREKHHYLLVTLLLANAFAMEALPVFLDRILSAVTAIVISVTVVLIMGEIIPQAICTGPNQIPIAAAVAPLLKIFMIVESIIAYPFSKLLDLVMGKHSVKRYSNKEIKALLQLHSRRVLKAHNVHFSADTGYSNTVSTIVCSAVDFSRKRVRHIMAKYEETHSLSLEKTVSYKNVRSLLSGYSRIPMFHGEDPQDVAGVLLAKTLTGVDLSVPRTFRDLVESGELVLRKPQFVGPAKSLGGLLKEFKKGRCHLALVTDEFQEMRNRYDSFCVDEALAKREMPEGAKKVILGVVSLEDVFEALIKDQIIDEVDHDLLPNSSANYNHSRSINADGPAFAANAQSQVEYEFKRVVERVDYSPDKERERARSFGLDEPLLDANGALESKPPE